MKRWLCVLLLLGLPTLTACARYSIYNTTRMGQIYVVRRVALRSPAVYTCDVVQGAPVCHRAREIRRAD